MRTSGRDLRALAHRLHRLAAALESRSQLPLTRGAQISLEDGYDEMCEGLLHIEVAMGVSSEELWIEEWIRRCSGE